MSSTFFNLFSKLHEKTMHVLKKFGLALRFFWFVVRTVAAGICGPFYRAIFWNQLRTMGWNSIPLIALTALFTGMVLALQSASAFANFALETTLPSIVTLSIIRELAPVLGGLMMAGRWGSAMAAEMATMRVTDQIDALITLSTHPLRYLVIPRVLASIISLPFLIFLADVIGILGGGLVATHHFSMLSGQYISKVLEVLSWSDVGSGMIKATIFGLIIGLIGCYQGYYASGGTQGVGQATTRSVVRSSVFILLMNFLLTSLLFQ